MQEINRNRNKGLMMFFIIPIVWGLSFIVTHNAVQIVNPGEFAFYRMLTASICLFPFAMKYLKEINIKVILWSFAIAACGTGNILCQAFALSQANSSKVAFYVTLNILFVPFIAVLFRVAKLELLEIVAVFIGVTSIFINFGGDLSIFSSGDAFGLMAALSIALNIVLTQKMLQHLHVSKILLTFLSIFFGAILLLYFPLHHSTISIIFDNHSVLFAVIYQGAMATALAYFIQIKYQKEIGATSAALIMNLDLAFAAIFGYFNHETMTVLQVVACVVAFTSSVFKDSVIFIRKKYKL
ncbi:MAG: DMT family transporter [Neisseriaceae bacterium]|nr:MAG: DMT family transporter [Neisseriaceae bacterium]